MGNCIWDYVGLYGKLYFSRWQCPPPFHTTLYRFSLNRILHYRKPINCVVYLVLLSTKCIFSVTRRSRSDSVSQSLTLRTELTDVTLVSEDTYRRLY